MRFSILFTGILVFTSFLLKGQELIPDSLLRKFDAAADDTNKVNLFREAGIGIIYQNPPAAIPLFRSAVNLSHKLKFNPGLERNYAAISTAYAFNGRFDSALIYIDTAIIYAKTVGDVSRLALVFLNRADALENLNNFSAALKNCDTAMKYAEQAGNKDRQARIFHIMASIYLLQNQLPFAMEYQDKAIVLFRETGNDQMVGQGIFSQAMILRKMNKPAEAIQTYRKAISIAESVRDFNNLSPYYGELAGLFLDEKNVREAEINGVKALQYAKQVGNLLQEAIVQAALAQVYSLQNKFPDAIKAGLASYAVVKSLSDLSREQGAAQILADIYSKAGNSNEAYAYQKISKELNDSLLKQQFSNETLKLQTAFDVAEKNKSIQLLNKDKELQAQRFFRQQLLIAGSVILAILALAGATLFINRNRLRHRMKELELRTKIAADLHDDVGSSLSSIHMLSQMAVLKGHEDTHKDILARMSSNAKETMDRMGDIVWMIKPGETDASSLKQRMERFAYEIGITGNIEMHLNLEGLEPVKLNMEQRKNIWLIFKEAVNNAAKYSGTLKMEITSVMHGKQLILLIKDFGKGFDSNVAKNGNGLYNMQHRAKELMATLTTESSIDTGTTIQLNVPV
jgi:signal transduction histidine kinase